MKDKTIKFWTIPELSADLAHTNGDSYPELPAPAGPTKVITTSYPVWRARHLPFGHGVLSLPQRGEDALEMFSTSANAPAEPIQRFEGHDDVVKEFVWRVRGGDNPDYEDREFQLVTWSKDRTLRIWPVGRDITERMGYNYGSRIEVLVSRRGAPDVTYTNIMDANERQVHLQPPTVQPSGIARQKAAKETGMTRGGGHHRGMDQLDWLTKVVKHKSPLSPESSIVFSRMGSMSRPGSRATSADDKAEWMSLRDELVLVNQTFPRPRVNFEKVSSSTLVTCIV